MNNAVNILREGSMMKALTKLGIPIVIAMLIMAIYNVVDTFWVARLGTLPVAAVSVVFPLSLLFLGIGLMFGVGGGVYISRLLGAKQVVKAGQVASVSVITSVILAALIALVCNAFLPDILLFMGANEGMMHLAEAYGRLFIISCVIGALNVSMSNIIVSQGASKISATAMIIGSVVNVALDPLFIYTFNWGVEGAAWATILSRIITTIIYIRFILSKAEVKVSFAVRSHDKNVCGHHQDRHLDALSAIAPNPFRQSVAESSREIWCRGSCSRGNRLENRYVGNKCGFRICQRTPTDGRL